VAKLARRFFALSQIIVVQGLQEQIKNATRANQLLNYEVIKDVLSTKLEPLLAAK
jgi:hypothetical protein